MLVHRLTGPSDTIIGAPLAGAPFADRNFVPARPVLWPLAGPGRYAAAVAQVLRRLHPDRIEVHNRPEIADRLRSYFPDVKLALFLHNDPQSMRRAHTVGQRKHLLAHMQVACVSEALRARFLEGLDTAHPGDARNGDREQVTVLPNCIDLERIPPSPPVRDPVILFAGRMVADKGADSFVSACAQVLPSLPGWRAEMIGADRFSVDSPETPFLAALRPQAAEAGIRLLGHLPHAAVLQAMARAAILVVPSRWQEPFGMIALEALACGTPLIVAPRPGLLEVVGDAALVAEPDVAGSLASALMRLASDPSLRARLSRAGRARAAMFDVPAARDRLQAFRQA